MEMRYGIRWEDKCLEDLVGIYDDQQTADDATNGATWALARAPLHRDTWAVAPGSDYRLTSVKPFLHYPAIAMSYSIIIEPPDQYCLMHRARRVAASGAA